MLGATPRGTSVGIRKMSAGVVMAGLLLLAGCANDDGGSATPTATGGSAAVSGPVTVFAASSLTEAFTRIGRDFEAANPGAKVTFSFAGSSALATQINQGAPADVFATAAPANMKTVTDAGNAAGTPTTFVKNRLVIAVPKGNPKGITGLAHLAGPGITVALC